MAEVIGHIVFTEEQIRQRAREIGAEISEDFKGEPIVLVGILRGAVMWLTDVMKCIDNDDLTIDFMCVSSYGNATKTSGVVRIMKDLDSSVDGKNVIIVEDIVESGITLNYLKDYIKRRNAKSVTVCALLDKPENRRVEIVPEYVGFRAPDKFIIGYGLDFTQKYRQLPYVSYIDQDE